MLKITNDGRNWLWIRGFPTRSCRMTRGARSTPAWKKFTGTGKTEKRKSLTQLVFCDLSTPKTDGTFSVYNDIRDKLLARGIPPEEIAFIHDANTDVRKKELFSKVRRGAVRILMGSTFKMGAGTNVQDRIIASHDLDCPWRPADVGRILRTFKIKKNVEVTDNGKIII